MGDPILLEGPPRPDEGCLNLGGPIGNGAGECAERGRASFGGEDAKHSSVDIKEREGAEEPLPNLNGGPSFREDFRDTDVVVRPLVRDNDVLIREDLLRLTYKSDRYNLFLRIHELLTLKVPNVSVAPQESLA